MPSQNWYEIAKTFDLKNYLETHYAMEFKKNFALCPFHADSNPTLSIKESGNFFQCFACGAAGDAAKFVELHDKLSSLDAVKKVLHDHGVNVGTYEADAEAEEKRAVAMAALSAEAAAKKAEREKEEIDLHNRSAAKMAEDAVKFSENLYEAIQQENKAVTDALKAVVPAVWSSSFDSGIIDNELGYDYKHESIVTINRDLDGHVYNIKHRQKFVWDDVEKKHTAARMEGKWISTYGAMTYPFGVNFIQSTDRRLIVCEGEKDAINLQSFGINAITLGGVNAVEQWKKYPKYFKDKEVYLWFDNDKPGYLAAMKSYQLLKNLAASVQIVMFFKMGNFSEKYDVSDFLVDAGISGKEAIFSKISYSCYSLTNTLIDECVQWLAYGKSDEERGKIGKEFTGYKSKFKVLEFQDINHEILKHAKEIKGEKDAEVEAFVQLQKYLSKSTLEEDLTNFISSLFKEQPKVIGAHVDSLRKVVSFKESFFNQYRQVHIVDVVMELIRSANVAGFEFAKYKNGLYIWTGMYYYYLQSWEIEDFVIQNFFKVAKMDWKKQTKRTLDEVLTDLAAHSPSLERWIDPEKRVINMLNGTLIVFASGKWLFKTIADKRDCALNVLPVIYTKEAKAPKWQRFLDRVLPDRQDQDALMEFIGYCFLPSHRFEKFLLLYGSTGANGKSVVLDVISDFFGRENTSSLPLHSFDGHQLDALNGKILNTGSEIESGGDLRKQFAALKTLTSSRESLTINPKNNPTYELYPEQKPKMAFATNKMPKSGADDGGVLRRMLVFVFDKEIKDDEKIRDLTERLADEKAGILNLALEGLGRLIKNGTFTESVTRKEFMEEFKDDINPIRAYKNECLIEKGGYMTPKKFIYAHYRAWCEEKGHSPYADRTFWTKLKEQMPKLDQFQPSRNPSDLLPDGARFIKDVMFDKRALGSFMVDKNKIETELAYFRHVGGVLLEIA